MTEELIVNCINLPHREDRLESAKQQAKEQGFYIRFWEGIIHRHDRKKGVNLAHRQIIQDAKDNGYKMVCVMEDDAIFTAPTAWDYFLEKMPEDFDIYFSMVYVGDIQDNRITGVFSSMTMYVVHQRFYDFFLSLPESIHLDRELGLYSDKFKYMVCDKFVCYQMGGKSDNSLMTIEDYSPYLIGRTMYSNG